MWILDRFKRSKEKQKPYIGVAKSSVAMASNLQWSGEVQLNFPDIFDELWRLYYTHPVVYSAVSKISKSAAQAPFFLYRINSRGEYEEVKDHWMYDLFESINSYTTVYDFWEELTLSLEVTGNFIAEIEFKNERPVALHYLYPSYVEIEVVDPYKPKLQYIYNIGKEIVVLPDDKVLHLKYFNPVNPLWGLPPLVPLFVTLTSDLYARNYNKIFFKNGAIVSGVLETDEYIGDEEYLKLLAQKFEEAHSGLENAHRVVVLDGGLKYKPVGNTPRDIEFLNLMKYAREEILSVLNVPPPVLGIYEYASYANAEASMKIFWRDKMVPLLTKIEQMITEFFIQRFDKNLYGKFDLSNITALREDEKLLAEIDAKLVQNGIMTVNERRAIRGLKPLEWGDTFFVPSNKVDVATMIRKNEDRGNK